MSTIRTIGDFPRNESGYVDRFIGTAYDAVKKVADNLDDILKVPNAIDNINSVRQDVDSKAAQVASDTQTVADNLELVKTTASAAMAASRLYTTVQDGLNNTSNGEYFVVPGPNNGEDFSTLYYNDNGNPEAINTYPSTSGAWDRKNHTGTQAIDTIDGLSDELKTLTQNSSSNSKDIASVRSNVVNSGGTSDISDQGLLNSASLTDAASLAYSDLIGHWWDSTHNRFWGQSGGVNYSNVEPFQWQKAMMVNVLYWQWKQNASSDAATKIGQIFTDLLSRYGQTTLSTASLDNDIGASDDAAWISQMFCQIHEVTGNVVALQIAADLIASARSVFADPNHSGSPYGLLYSLTLKHSTLYEVGLALAAIYCYQHNGDSTLYDYAVNTASWITKYMKNSRNVYWREFNLDSTSSEYMNPHLDGKGSSAPIQRGFSYSMLAGNMAACLLNNLLYKISGNSSYNTECQSVIGGIFQDSTFMNGFKCLFNDSDGWIGGYYFARFANDLIKGSGNATWQQVMANTALSAANLRTDDVYISMNDNINYGSGYYGSDWGGPGNGLDSSANWPGDEIYPEDCPSNGANISVIQAGAIINIYARDQFVTSSKMMKMISNILYKVSMTKNPVFSGGITAPYVYVGSKRTGSSFYLGYNEINPAINFADGVAFEFDVKENKLSFQLSSSIVPLKITAGGIEVDGITINNVVQPGATNSSDLGSTALWWKNAYVQNICFGNRTDSYIGLNYGIPCINFVAGAAINFDTTNTKFIHRVNNQDAMYIDESGLTIKSVTSNGVMQPGTDNSFNLGAASQRWATVYAGTGSINTSDARLKTAVTPLTADEIEAAKQIVAELGTYQFLDAVASKGSASARKHMGTTVQRVIQIMSANNLDWTKYAFICYDSWDAKDAVLDSVTKEVVTPAVAAGDLYSFRTDELNMFLARGLDARLTAIEAALAASKTT